MVPHSAIDDPSCESMIRGKWESLRAVTVPELGQSSLLEPPEPIEQLLMLALSIVHIPAKSGFSIARCRYAGLVRAICDTTGCLVAGKTGEHS